MNVAPDLNDTSLVTITDSSSRPDSLTNESPSNAHNIRSQQTCPHPRDERLSVSASV